MFDPYDAVKLAEDAILSHSRLLEVGGSVERKPYTPPLLLSGNGSPTVQVHYSQMSIRERMLLAKITGYL